MEVKKWMKETKKRQKKTTNYKLKEVPWNHKKCWTEQTEKIDMEDKWNGINGTRNGLDVNIKTVLR